MNAANRSVPIHRTTRQRVSSWWLVSSLVLVLAFTLRFAIADEEYAGLLEGAGGKYRQMWYPASQMLGAVEGMKA